MNDERDDGMGGDEGRGGVPQGEGGFPAETPAGFPPAGPPVNPPWGEGADMGPIDEKISNTGQRVRAVLVIIVLLAIGIGGYVWWSGKKTEIARHEKVKKDFAAAHVAGYKTFWDTCKIPISEMKNNQIMMGRLDKMALGSEESFGKFIKTTCLPVWDQALPLYRGILGPEAYRTVLEKIAEDAQAIQKAFVALGDFLVAYPERVRFSQKITDAGNKWLLYQQGGDVEKSLIPADNYVHLMQCILKDKPLADISVDILQDTLRMTCAKDAWPWFDRVERECMPIMDKTEKSGDDLLDQCMKAFVSAENLDGSSVFGITDCLKKAENQRRKEILTEVTKAWMNYTKDMAEFDKQVDDTMASMK